MTIALPARKEILKDLWMAVTLMPRDITTWWNSMLNLLEYALKHHKAINIVTQWHELGLQDLELTDEEWVIVGQLQGVLKVSKVLVDWCVWNNTNKCNQVLKDATLYFSCSTPNLAMVIPAMDHINQVLSMYLHNKSFLPSIHSGVSLTQELSIVTTHAWTSPKCITLPWVSTALTSFSNHLLT